MMTDPIADFLTQIRNAYMAGKESISVPFSKIKEQIAKILLSEGYIRKVEIKIIDKNKKMINADLIYDKKIPKMSKITRVSKPGRRVYVNKDSIPKVLGGMGMVILSTSGGVMTGKEAKAKKVGGEIICKIW